ncbi:MAG: hypothetical protein FD152_3247 [Xanthobacteraceae bacterium]|nr:MAG: hypothetical protein FD152_3247 [Xanthobacteraceae bacterium]
MTAPILSLANLHKSYGALKVTDGVTLDIAPRELHAPARSPSAART